MILPNLVLTFVTKWLAPISVAQHDGGSREARDEPGVAGVADARAGALQARPDSGKQEVGGGAAGGVSHTSLLFFHFE